MRSITYVSTLALFGFVLGCTDVGFKSVPSATCTNFAQGKEQNCTFTPQGNVYSVTFKTGQLDILFVNDNSGSMSSEQSKMANAFSGFLNLIDDYDYRIAMVTTDMEKDQGNLVTFYDENDNTDGEKFLQKDSQNTVSKFKGTIQREETLVCDNNGYQSAFCPSTDERGIYAAHTALANNELSWLRPGAHTAIVALTDESQRSHTEWSSELQDWEGQIFGKSLEDKDRPESLVQMMASKYLNKTLSAHPIIVRPGDSQCRNSQTRYFDLAGHPLQFALKGHYGNLWNDFANSTSSGLSQYGNIVDGQVGSICEATYYNQLNLTASYLGSGALRNVVNMQCSPALDKIEVTSSQAVDYRVDQEAQQIIFENLPVGVEVTASWVCGNEV